MTLPVVANSRVERIASGAGCALVFVALIALFGWAFRVPFLVSGTPGLATMRPNTALAFLFSGLALIRRTHRDSYFYSAAVLLIGGLTTLEYVSNADFCIDQLLFRDPQASIFPGRMSQITAVALTLLGPALALMRFPSRNAHRASSSLSFIVGGLGAIALLGYSYETNALYQVRPHSSMAFNTALALIMATIGVQCANPAEGLVSKLHADGSGGAMLRRLLPAALLIPYSLGFAVWMAQKNFDWDSGFSLALLVAGVMVCVVFLVLFNASRLEREDFALRESEERFRLVANTAPVMIWMSGTDKLCNYFNNPWLDFTGRALEEELGDGWAQGLHPQDLESCLHNYVDAFDKRQSFRMQYRLRRHDGEYRWILDIGVPRFNPDCSFAGYIGSCIDITDRMLAEEALADVGRRLIEAQDQERCRIARELHDDISQHIAVLTIQLQRWDQNTPAANVEMHDRLAQVLEQLSAIGANIRDLSHRLHSSYLDYLGLAAAAASYCREISEQRNVEIDFSYTAMPEKLPSEVSLCLFRVLQEALQNAVKHSCVRRFTVRLSGDSGAIHLSVRDTGIGFDQWDTAKRRGLGLISMRERLRLVKGELSVNSEPDRGTTIVARVPISAPEHQAHWSRTA